MGALAACSAHRAHRPGVHLLLVVSEHEFQSPAVAHCESQSERVGIPARPLPCTRALVCLSLSSIAHEGSFQNATPQGRGHGAGKGGDRHLC